MALKLTWKPVLQALPLKEYHPDYEDNVIMACVNPQPEFLQERTQLMAEYSMRLLDVQAARQKRTRSSEETKQIEEKQRSFDTWCEQIFQPGMQIWFARLWSFGSEIFTADDLNEYDRIDPHLVAWLKRRSIEMIDEHRLGRKKV